LSNAQPIMSNYEERQHAAQYEETAYRLSDINTRHLSPADVRAILHERHKAIKAKREAGRLTQLVLNKLDSFDTSDPKGKLTISAAEAELLIAELERVNE
jgi:hypothetical protein